MSNVEFEFDGAEGIAFWVSEDDTFENNIRVMFDDLDKFKVFLEKNLPGLFVDNARELHHFEAEQALTNIKDYVIELQDWEVQPHVMDDILGMIPEDI